MKLGHSVNELLPLARGGGALRMGVVALSEAEWLRPDPDLAARAAAFDAFPGAVQQTDAAQASGAELAGMLGTSGGLEGAARAQWEDLCLLTCAEGEDVYRLAGAAVAFPTDWDPADKLGRTLAELHGPIHGYREQLASGVDHFMAKLKPGAIYGRANWFVAPTDALRWVGEPPEAAFGHVTPENAGERLFVRCERQTLRRLPQTGAILFTIGVHVAPLGSLDAANLAKLAEALRTIPDGEAARRGAAFFASQLQAFAEARARANEAA